jgi:hypothetical protein
MQSGRCRANDYLASTYNVEYVAHKTSVKPIGRPQRGEEERRSRQLT